ncbi:hypothetical protein N9Q27_00075 [bacterium]|nr:hypothetical protein [bacterium]
MMDVENWINQIVQTYPWASEDTMLVAFGEQTRSNLTARQAVAKLRNDPASWQSIVDEIKKNTDRSSTFNRYTKELSQSSSAIIKSMARDDSINAINELAFNFAKGLDGIANAADELTDSARWLSMASTGRFGNLVRAVETGVDFLNVGANTVIGTVAIGGIALKFIQDQEKALRTMIDFGILSNDLSVFNEIRDNAASLGMTQQDFIKEFSDFGPIFTNMTTNAADGYQQFTDMTAAIKQTDTFSTYGIMLRDYAKQIAENTKLAYNLSQMTEFNENTKAQLAETFKTNSTFALSMANATGEKRDDLLSARKDALSGIELIAAMDQNFAYITEQFGENGARNITENIGFLRMLMAPLPDDFADESIDIITRSLYDVQFDGGNILNNISDDMLKMLTALGPDVKNQYLEMMQTIVQGGYDASDPGQITNDYLDLMQSIKATDPVTVTYLEVKPEQVNARMIQDIVRILPESAFSRNLTLVNLNEATTDTAATLAGQAVAAISSIGVFTATIKNGILPEYDTTANAINNFGTGLAFLENAMDVIDMSGRRDEVIDLDSGAENRAAMMEQRESMLRDLESVRTVEEFNAVLDSHNLPGLTGGSINMPASDISHLFGRGETTDSAGRPSASSEVVAARLIAALDDFGITNPQAQANVLGMVSGESGFRLLEETSYRNTDVSRIRAAMASRAQFYTDAEIEQLKTDDRAFFDAMYGTEQSNRRQVARDSGLSRADTGGSISPQFIRGGDMGGYDYRGRGYIQLTGRENYRRVGEMVGVDLVENPDLVVDPYWAPRVAAAFYAIKSQSERAKMTDAREVYRMTWGAYPDTAMKIADAQNRAGIGAAFLQRIQSGEMANIDTSLSQAEQDYVNQTRGDGELQQQHAELTEQYMLEGLGTGRQAGDIPVLEELTNPTSINTDTNDSDSTIPDTSSLWTTPVFNDEETQQAIREMQEYLATAQNRQVTTGNVR